MKLTAMTKLRILIIGAHPDDCELQAGGLTAMYRADGHHVKYVSVTRGDAGHHSMVAPELARRRELETKGVADLMGIEYEILPYPDGGLVPTIEARHTMIRLIRRFRPDLILTHRPNDYHPDHRATSTLVCDAAYMVTVPLIAPEAPALRTNPIIAYLSDSFTKPCPLSPRVVIDIEPVLEQVVNQLACHVSQFYEWLPYNQQIESSLPTDDAGKREWLKGWYLSRISPLADRFRDLVVQTYGPERGAKIRYIEAFEPCEYGSPMTDGDIKRLFPMLP